MGAQGQAQRPAPEALPLSKEPATAQAVTAWNTLAKETATEGLTAKVPRQRPMAQRTAASGRTASETDKALGYKPMAPRTQGVFCGGAWGL